MTNLRDVVIIGAGHNGLITAFYLAKAGLKPLVLERRRVVGGAAITEEFHPGFKCSILAHSCGPLRPEIFRDMQLERHGVEMIQPEPRVVALSCDGRALPLYSELARSAQEIARFSKRDAEKYVEFQSVLNRLVEVIRRLMSQTPPAIDKLSLSDLWGLFTAAREVRSLGKKDTLRLLRWAPMPVADLVAEWFENELLRATIAARGIFGMFLGPRSAGSSAVLLLRAARDPHPAGGASFVKGGLGALTQGMAAAAVQAGAEIRTGVEVARIAARDGSATGVVLRDGEEIAAKAVISNADPRRTFLRLVDPAHLEPDFLIRMQNYRCMGTVAKVNLALAGLPSFAGLAGANSSPAKNALAGRIHIGPEVDYLERAFDDAKYGEFSRAPILDVTIPSLADPSLAPPGKHVLSVCVQFAPYKLRNGTWQAKRDELADTVVKTLGAYAPDLPGLVLHRQVITPLDLEETYGLTGGHIFHGELALDQLFALRPVLGWARYRTPLRGLYLCGSGTHPGSGLTGDSGRNAAGEFLKDWKRPKHKQEM